MKGWFMSDPIDTNGQGNPMHEDASLGNVAPLDDKEDVRNADVAQKQGKTSHGFRRGRAEKTSAREGTQKTAVSVMTVLFRGVKKVVAFVAAVGTIALSSLTATAPKDYDPSHVLAPETQQAKKKDSTPSCAQNGRADSNENQSYFETLPKIDQENRARQESDQAQNDFQKNLFDLAKKTAEKKEEEQEQEIELERSRNANRPGNSRRVPINEMPEGFEEEGYQKRDDGEAGADE